MAVDILGPVVNEYYGSTETGVNTIADSSDLATCPASVGRPFKGNEIVVVGPDLIPLATGRTGRVAINSYMNMDGYVGMPTETVTIAGRRFILMPDYGYLDSEGRLYILNRSGGFDWKNALDIYGAEDELRTLGYMEDVSVLVGDSAPEDTGVSCAVVLRDPVPQERVADDASRILRRFSMRLASIRVVDRIPYSLSGKVKRKELETAFAASVV